MAKYLTHLFEEYREHARHLRNTAFDTRTSQDWGVVEDFEAVSTVLFERLVLYRLPEGHCQQAKDWKDTSYFLIEPADGGFAAMISRDKGASGYWDHPIKMLLKGEAVIAFHQYFDWDQHARIDLRYYYGMILESSRYPDLAGHHILIETDMAWIASNPSKVEEAG